MSSRARIQTPHVAPLLAMFCALVSPAYADDATETNESATQAKREVRWAGPLELIVDGEGAAFPIKAHEANATFLWFPRGVKDWTIPRGKGFSVQRWGPNALYVKVDDNTPVGTEAGLRIWSREFQCSLHLEAVEKLSEITRQDSIVVKHGDDKRRELEEQAKRLAARTAREAEAMPRPTDDGEPRGEPRDPSHIVARDLMKRDQRPVLRPYFRVERLNDNALDVAFIDGQWVDQNDFLVRFSAENTALQPSSLYHVSTLDRDGVMLDVDVIYPRTDEDRAKGRIATLGAGDRIEGGLLIRNAADHDLDGLHFEFHSLLGTRTVSAIGEVTHFRPISEHEIENTERDREALGRIAIQVQPMFGIIWLENPLQADDLDATSVMGLGVRVGYGINRFLSVEGEVMGASSGEANFSGTLGGATGNATRNARLGRVQIGGVLRLGYQYIPTLRLGIGFQGADHGTHFTPDNGSPMDVPGDGFIGKAFFAFGAGFDVKLGTHWSVGIEAAYAQSIGTEASLLTGGLHLSYGWKPASQRF